MSKHQNRVPRIRHRRLFVEGLEPRAMLAGNVTASVSGQTLFIRGNNSDNGVVITQTGATSYLVTGIPDLGTSTPTTVNGGAAFAAAKVLNFDIDLGAGNDVLGIGNNTTFLADLAAEAVGGATPAAGVAADAVTLRGYANIRMGAGDDAVGIQLTTPSGVLIQTGAGSDAVAVEAGSEGVLTIITDTGNQSTDAADFARVRGATLTGAVTVTTQAGDDTVNLSDVSAAFIGVYPGVGATNAGVTDHDSVFGFNLTSRSSVDVVSLAGDDDDELNAVVSNNVLIDAGAGNDYASLENVTIKTATILGQGGNDHIDIFDGPAGNISVNLLIDSGAGNDGVHLFGNNTEESVDFLDLGAATLLTGSGNDGLFMENVHVRNNLFIDMGAGDDSTTANPTLFGEPGGATLDGVTVDKILTAFLGSGNDSATGSNVKAAKGSSLFGGAGSDTFTDGGGNSPNIKVYEIETFLP